MGVLIIFLLILTPLATAPKTQPGSTPQTTQSTPQSEPQSEQSFSVPTNSPSKSAQLREAIAEQTKVDQEYAGWEKSVSDSYPWRKKLPLTSEKYYVYFDLNTKVFIGRLYTTSGDNVEQIKSDILKILKVDEEIPIENFKFEWNVFPK